MQSTHESKVEGSSVTGTALASFSLFEALNLEERESLACCFKLKHYSRNQYVISSTHQDTDVFFILSGNIQACAFSENGRQIHFEELSAGMMFGELSAIDQRERSSECICLSETKVAVISRNDFMRIVSENDSVNRALLVRLATLVRTQLRKIYEFSSFSVAQRLRLELLRMASSADKTEGLIEFDSVPTHAEIASRISTHREAVTRELKLLETQNIITWKRGNYAIHDTSRLISEHLN